MNIAHKTIMRLHQLLRKTSKDCYLQVFQNWLRVNNDWIKMVNIAENNKFFMTTQLSNSYLSVYTKYMANIFNKSLQLY